jgi:membrane protein YqaA with SNARE-associated domain
MLKRLSNWVLRWAETSHAQFALFVLAFAEASFFPIPPDVLLIAMVIARADRWLKYFGICLIGSVLGGMAGYAIGWGAWQAVSGWFFQYVFAEEAFEKVRAFYQQYDFWAVFAAGLTPIPYKIFTIAGGVAQINFPTFVLASCLSRGIRFFAVAFILKLFGPSVKILLEKHLNWLTVAFFILLVGGFVLLKVFFH